MSTQASPDFKSLTAFLPEVNQALEQLGAAPCNYTAFWRLATTGLIEEIVRDGKALRCRPGTAPKVAERIVELRRASAERTAPP